MIFTDVEILIRAIRSNNHYEINKWEADFLDSLESQMAMDVQISARQAAKLQDIYRQCYGDNYGK